MRLTHNAITVRVMIMMDLMMKDSDNSVPFGNGDSMACNDDLMLITNQNKGTEETDSQMGFHESSCHQQQNRTRA